MRAGYLGASGEPTSIGHRVIERLENLARATTDLWQELGLEVHDDSNGMKIFLVPEGATEILSCPVCGYAAPADLAKAGHALPQPEEMLPSEMVATPNCNTIDALATFLGMPTRKTAKAMMYARVSDSRFIFIVIRGDSRMSEHKLQRLMGPLKPATPEQITAAGAVAGYASPVGLHGAYIVVDEQIPRSPNLAAGANKAGFHLKNTNCGRDYQADLVADLAMVNAGGACPNCGNPLAAARGLVVEESGEYRFAEIMLALAEKYHDDRGLTWPPSAAAFDIHLLHLASKDVDTLSFAEGLYLRLESAGLPTLFDDRDERAGVKFFDADLIGLPLRLTVGGKNLADGMIELKPRGAERGQLVPAQEAVEAALAAGPNR